MGYFLGCGRVQKLCWGFLVQTNDFCFLSSALFLLYHAALILYGGGGRVGAGGGGGGGGVGSLAMYPSSIMNCRNNPCFTP